MKTTRKVAAWLLTLALLLTLAPPLGGTARAVGSAENPYQIGTKEQLAAFRDIVNNGKESACAVLTADIDLQGSDSNRWTPISAYDDKEYTSTFDGQGHSITGLYVDSTDTFAGLFGYVAAGGTVKNLTVGGTVNGGQLSVGGVVDWNYGTVTNCSNTGAVTGTSNVGGVVGYNYGTVTNCSNAGAVTGASDVGGVVGYNYVNFTVTNCSNTGAVNGNYFVGGVAGFNSGGAVTNCSNTGAVTGTGNHVGGVAGYNQGSTVTNCSNTGTVSGNQYVGGVAGDNDNSTAMTGCCYVGTVGGVNGADTSGATGLDAEAFKNPDKFPGWDFENTWYMGENGPVLRAKEPTPAAAFAATGADSGELSGLTASASYSISGAGLTSATEITADTSGKCAIASGLAAGTLSVVKKGGNTTANSDAQSIAVTKAATPSLTVTQPTTIDGTGSVATDSTHEYSADGTSWTACTGTLTGLAQGSARYVRVKASGTVLASANQTVTINTFTGTKEPTPTTASFAATGYDTGTLSGVTSGMKYSTDGTSWTDIADSTDIALTSLTAPCTISVKKTGNGSTTTDSDPQEISVTRAATPSLTVTQPTTIDGTGSVATDSTHEWSENGTSGWTACTGALTGLAQGSTRYVRVAASGTVLASANQTVTISTVTTYAVTVTNDGHGTGSASPDSGASGTVVTLTASPNAGYHFKAWQVVSGGVSITGNRFTIGTEDVTVKATFEANAPTPSSTTTTTYNPDGSVTKTTTNADGSKTAVTTTKDGSTATVKTDKNGNIVSVEAAPSAKAISDAAAKGEPVTLPVTVKAAGDAASAVPVTITLPANSGRVTVEIPTENLTAGTVAYLVNADGTEEIVKTSTTGENGVVLTLDGSATVKIVDNTKTFTDVSGDEWFANNVAWAASHEIMNGVGNGNFDADAETTQGMMEQILYNLDGNALVAPAEGEAWWSAADGWAANGGVTNGVAAHDPSAPATREVDVLMMFNYAKAKGYDTTARADLSAFSDADGVSDWAREAMAWAVAVGIINGTTDGNGNAILNAQGVATRAQISAITQRFCEKAAK